MRDGNIGVMLRPERIVRRSLPLNVTEAEQRLFTHEVERVLPAVALRQLRAVQVNADGLLFNGWRLLPESFAFPSLKDELRVRSLAKLVAVNIGVRTRRQFAKRAVWITDTWSIGYFHWLTDALSRLLLIRDLAQESTLLLPHAFRTLDYVAASIEAFDLDAVEFVGANELLLVRALTLPEHAAPSGHYDEEVIRSIATILISRYGALEPRREPARIYISRANARKRRIRNESAVIDILRDRGFRIVLAEQMTFRDQVRLCSAARVLVSSHGAGLTNMLFMPPPSKVLELRHHTDAVNNCYFTLAAALRHPYFFQGCAPVHPSEDPHTADVLVDIGTLKENLDLLLAR